jgi:hypothetical protein
MVCDDQRGWLRNTNTGRVFNTYMPECSIVRGSPNPQNVADTRRVNKNYPPHLEDETGSFNDQVVEAALLDHAGSRRW